MDKVDSTSPGVSTPAFRRNFSQKQRLALPATSIGIKFEKEFLRVWEDEGKLDVHIVREGTAFPGRVRVITEDGTAKTGVNFSHIDETVEFLTGQDRMVVPIDIFNDPNATGKLDFYVKIMDPDTRKKPDLEEDDEGKLCKVRIADTDTRWSSRIRKSDTMNRLIIFWTIFALFVHDLWIMIDIPNQYDNVLGWTTVICFVFFLFEFVVNSASLGSKYYCSTTGFLDLLAAVGILTLIRLEIDGNRIDLFSGFATGAVLARTARVARIAGRAGRATRIPKLIGQTVACIIDMVTWCLLSKTKENPEEENSAKKAEEEKSQAGNEHPNFSQINTDMMLSPEETNRLGAAAKQQLPRSSLKARRMSEKKAAVRHRSSSQHGGEPNESSSGVLRSPRRHRGARSVSRVEGLEMKSLGTNKSEIDDEKEPSKSKRHSEHIAMMGELEEEELIDAKPVDAMDDDEVAADAGKVGGAALEVLTSKVTVMLIILLILTATLGSLETEDATQREMGLEMLVRTAEATGIGSPAYEEVLTIYTDGSPEGTRWNPNKPLLYLKVNGTEIIDDATVDHLRYTEMLYASIGGGCGPGDVADDLRDPSCLHAAIFNNRQAEFIIAANGLILTICLTVIVTIGMAIIAYDFQNLIFAPMRRITISIEKAVQIIFGGLLKKKELEDDYDDDGVSVSGDDDSDDDDDGDSDSGSDTKSKSKSGRDITDSAMGQNSPAARREDAGGGSQELDQFIRFDTSPRRAGSGKVGSGSNPNPLDAAAASAGEHRIDIKRGDAGGASTDSVPGRARISTLDTDPDSRRQTFDTPMSPGKSALERMLDYMSPREATTEEGKDDEEVKVAQKLHLLDTFFPRSLKSKWSKLQIQIKTAFVDVQKAFGINTGGWNEDLRKANRFVTEIFHIREEVYDKVQHNEFTWAWLRDHLVVTTQEKLELNENHLLEAFLGAIRNDETMRQFAAMVLAVYEGRLKQRSAKAKIAAASTVNVDKKRRLSAAANYDGETYQNMEETTRRLYKELGTMSVHTLRTKLLTLIAIEHLRVIKLMQKSCHDFSFKNTIHRINHSFNRIHKASKDPAKRAKVRLWMVVDQASNVTIQDCVRYAVSKCLNEEDKGPSGAVGRSRRSKKRPGGIWSKFDDTTPPEKVLKEVEKYLCDRGLAEYERLRVKERKGQEDNLPEFKGNRRSLKDVSEALDRTDSKMQLPVNIAHLFYKIPIHKYLSVLGPIWNIKHTELVSCSFKAYLSGVRKLLMNTMVVKKFGHRAQTFLIQFALLVSSLTEGDESLSRALRRVALDKRKAKLMRRMASAYIRKDNRDRMLKKTLASVEKFTTAQNSATEAPYFTEEESTALGVYLTRRVKVASYAVTAVATVAKVPPYFSVHDTFRMFGIWALKGSLPVMLSSAVKQDPEFQSKRIVSFAEGKMPHDERTSFRNAVAIVSKNYVEEMVSSALRVRNIVLTRNMRHPKFYEDLEEKIVTYYVERLVKQGILSAEFLSAEGDGKTAEAKEEPEKEGKTDDGDGPDGKMPSPREKVTRFKTLWLLNHHVKNLLRAECAKDVLPALAFSNADPPGILQQKLSVLPYDRKDVRDAMVEGLARHARLAIPATVGEFFEDWIRKTGTAPFALLSILDGSSEDLLSFGSSPRLLSSSMTDLRLVTMISKGFVDLLRAQKVLAGSVQETINVPLEWITSLDFNVVEMYQHLRSKAYDGTLSGYDVRTMLAKLNEVLFEEKSLGADVCAAALRALEQAEAYAISISESLDDAKADDLGSLYGRNWDQKHLVDAKRKLAANNITASVDLNQAAKLLRKWIEKAILIGSMQLDGASGGAAGLSDPSKLVDLIHDEKLPLGATLERVGLEILIQIFCRVAPPLIGKEVDRSIFDECKTIQSAREVAETAIVDAAVTRILKESGDFLRADQKLALKKCKTLSELRENIRSMNKDAVFSLAINTGGGLKDLATNNREQLLEKLEKIGSSNPQAAQILSQSKKLNAALNGLPLNLNSLVSQGLRGNFLVSILATMCGVAPKSKIGVIENLINVSKYSLADFERALILLREMGLKNGIVSVGSLQTGVEMLKKLDAGLQGMMALQGFTITRPSVDLSMFANFTSFALGNVVNRSIEELDDRGVELDRDRIMGLLRPRSPSLLDFSSGSSSELHDDDEDYDGIERLYHTYTKARAIGQTITQDLFTQIFTPIFGNKNLPRVNLSDCTSARDMVLRMEAAVTEAVAARATDLKLPKEDISRLLKHGRLKECADFISKMNRQAIIDAFKKQGHIARDAKANWDAVEKLLSKRPELNSLIEKSKLFNDVPTSIQEAINQMLSGSDLSLIVKPYLDGNDNPFDFLRAVVENKQFKTFIDSNEAVLRSVIPTEEIQKGMKKYGDTVKAMYEHSLGKQTSEGTSKAFDYTETLKMAQISLKTATGMDAFDLMKTVSDLFSRMKSTLVNSESLSKVSKTADGHLLDLKTAVSDPTLAARLKQNVVSVLHNTQKVLVNSPSSLSEFKTTTSTAIQKAVNSTKDPMLLGRLETEVRSAAEKAQTMAVNMSPGMDKLKQAAEDTMQNIAERVKDSKVIDGVAQAAVKCGKTIDAKATSAVSGIKKASGVATQNLKNTRESKLNQNVQEGSTVALSTKGTQNTEVSSLPGVDVESNVDDQDDGVD